MSSYGKTHGTLCGCTGHARKGAVHGTSAQPVRDGRPLAPSPWQRFHGESRRMLPAPKHDGGMGEHTLHAMCQYKGEVLPIPGPGRLTNHMGEARGVVPEPHVPG